MNLKKYQHYFQSYILKNDPRILKNIVASKTLSANAHMAIYQNSYYERIIGAMRQDFPIILATLGERAFASLVRDYINHHPSRDFDLRHIGQHLSDFLKKKDAYFLPFSDLAALEYSMSQPALYRSAVISDFNIAIMWEVFHREHRLLPLSLKNNRVDS